MAKRNKPTDSEQVTAHINKLSPEIAPVVEHIRQMVLSIDTEIANG